MLNRRLFLAASASLVAPRIALAQSTPVRIGFIPILAAGPIFVADREGWLKEGGLAPAFTNFESGPAMIQALASGTLDIYVAGVAPLGVARARGVDVKVLAATASEENVFLAGEKLSPFFAGGVSAREAFRKWRETNKTPARLATQPLGSVPNTTLQYWLWEVAKVDKADVTIVPMGIDATQQAVLAGAVEGGTLREPAVTIVMERNPAIKLVARGGEMFPNQPGTVVAVTSAFIKKNPEGAQRIVDSVVRSVKLIAAEPDRVTPHIGAALGRGIVDPAIIRKALSSPATKFIADPALITDATAAMQAYQVKIGALEKEESLEGLFDRSFFVKAAAKP